MFDESGDVINRIVFLNEYLGVLEVPPQALLEIGEDALEVVIGNEVGEKHKEEEKKFDEHNDSPALILHGVEFDSNIKNYKDKADTDKNHGTFIIILFHFCAPFDFSWLLGPERK
jgi:hypothetical protein